MSHLVDVVIVDAGPSSASSRRQSSTNTTATALIVIVVIISCVVVAAVPECDARGIIRRRAAATTLFRCRIASPIFINIRFDIVVFIASQDSKTPISNSEPLLRRSPRRSDASRD